LKLEDLRFDVSMKNAVSVHVFYSFENLIYLVFNFLFWDVILSAIDCVVEIAIHKFKDES